MSSCPERAQKIVDLLLNDTGVGAVFFRPKRSKGIPGKKIHVCSGCKEEFEPEYRSRQFCSRQCYMDYLARKRKRRKPNSMILSERLKPVVSRSRISSGFSSPTRGHRRPVKLSRRRSRRKFSGVF